MSIQRFGNQQVINGDVSNGWTGGASQPLRGVCAATTPSPSPAPAPEVPPPQPSTVPPPDHSPEPNPAPQPSAGGGAIAMCPLERRYTPQ
jgi:hypothetical protein